MSLKATVVPVSCTVSDGTSPATILQNRQSVMPSCVWVATLVLQPDHYLEDTGRRIALVTMGGSHGHSRLWAPRCLGSHGARPQGDQQRPGGDRGRLGP